MTKIAIVPIYNEGRNLERVLELFSARMDMTIAVNDGSTDDSSAILSRWIPGQPRSYVIDNPVNRGKASALKDGFSLVALLLEQDHLRETDLLYTFDADGQHTVDSIDELARVAIEQKLDMLLTRRDFSRYPRFKKIGNWGLSAIASVLGGYRYADVECGLRVLKVGRIPEILAYYNGYKYSSEQELGIIAAGLGYRIDNSHMVEVPYYRAGTKVPDGLINITFGMLAWLRLHLGLRSSSSGWRDRLTRSRILAGPESPLPSTLEITHRAHRPAPTGAAHVAVKLDR